MAAPYGAASSQSQIQAAMDGPSYPNPNVQGNLYIYLAVYSSVPVYEMMVRGIGVMRRRTDSWLNATQILKVAGVDKGKRTKILEKDIAQGVHEKIQGGYGRYQGTWIPFERAVELANAFGVSHLIAPLFDYTAPPPPVALNGAAPPPAITNPYALEPSVPLAAPPMQQMPSQQQQMGQGASEILQQARQQGLLPSPTEHQHQHQQQHQPIAGPSGQKRMGDVLNQEELKRSRTEHSHGYNGNDNNGSSFHAPPSQPSSAALLASPPLTLPAESKLSNFRTTLSLSTQSPIDISNIDPVQLERSRGVIKSVFALETPEGDSTELSLTTLFPADVDPDTPIDESLHTALHWAAALARIPLVRALVNFGADQHRGNNDGETPLIRAILVTNNSDQDSFLPLLQILAPSLRTVDEKGRSVLHHAAIVAGVKGRANSARYYLETVLEYIATAEEGQFRGLIDAQDSHGDTALNIAARIGNRALVRTLLDAGADKFKVNKLGLRATDYGVDDPDLVLNAAQETIEALRDPPAISDVPVQASQDILRTLKDKLSSLTSTFTSELESKTQDLVAKRQQVQDLTAQLAEQRREHQRWREEVSRTEEQAQRIKNLQNAIDDEDAFDWTGRTEIDGSPASALAGAGFTYRGPGSTLSQVPSSGLEFDADPPVPEMSQGVTGETLVHLLRLQAWYERVEGLMRQRLEKLEGGNVELEAKLRKTVAGTCGVEESRVDDMLVGLVTSLETDSSALDLGRVAGFLNRVKDGSL